MRVVNRRTGKSVEAEEAFGMLRKIKGLMFRKKPTAILFDFRKEGAHPIHSLFVFFPFYAVYIGENGEVVEKFRVEPFCFLKKNSVPARYLLELGAEQGDLFEKGDRVDFYAGVENS
jgi:uncharacterized membrane protein (UPF0127 family)